MAYVYVNKADMQLYHDARTLVQLTNDDDTIDVTDATLISDTVLTAAENSAAQTINNYLRDLYTIPLAGSEITQEIKEIASHLTWWCLWRRRDYMPALVVELYNISIARLNDMKQGKEIRLGMAVAKAPAER